MERCILQMGMKSPALTAFLAGDGDLQVFSHKGVPRKRGNRQGKQYPEKSRRCRIWFCERQESHPLHHSQQGHKWEDKKVKNPEITCKFLSTVTMPCYPFTPSVLGEIAKKNAIDLFEKSSITNCWHSLHLFISKHPTEKSDHCPHFTNKKRPERVTDLPLPLPKVTQSLCLVRAVVYLYTEVKLN